MIGTDVKPNKNDKVKTSQTHPPTGYSQQPWLRTHRLWRAMWGCPTGLRRGRGNRAFFPSRRSCGDPASTRSSSPKEIWQQVHTHAAGMHLLIRIAHALPYVGRETSSSYCSQKPVKIECGRLPALFARNANIPYISQQLQGDGCITATSVPAREKRTA